MTPKVEQWRPLVARVLAARWPDLPNGVEWILAQIEAESGGDPHALSPAGARGLLQLMPLTAKELGVTAPLDPEQNVDGGVRYLKIQFDHLSEVPGFEDRLRWAFACYNGGRGYVNQAFRLARQDREDRWTQWARGRFWLFHRDGAVGGRVPGYREMWAYVARIEKLVTGRAPQ